MDFWIILRLLPVVIVGTFILIFITIVLLEKQHVRDFVPAQADDATGDSPYFNAMNEAAQRLGFVPAGLFKQNRSSKIYQARVALWISQDGHMLLMVCGGKTTGVPIKRTLLTTIIEPESIVQTQDEFGMADLSGLTSRQIVLHADLEELLARHRERLASATGPARTFSAGTALADWESIQSMKSERMARLGLIKFLNPEHSISRHTLKGAWMQYYQGFRGQLAEGKAQADRASKKRPGSN